MATVVIVFDGFEVAAWCVILLIGIVSLIHFAIEDRRKGRENGKVKQSDKRP